MKKTLYGIIAIILFIPYILAYAIAHTFKMKDAENMPTTEEWFEPLHNM